jgi:hypothetical protein
MAGRRPKPGQVIYLRVPEDAIEELDRWVDELRAAQPGMSGISRADLMRDILVREANTHREARAPATSTKPSSSTSTKKGSSSKR